MKIGAGVFPSGANAGPDRRLVFEIGIARTGHRARLPEPRADSSCEVRGQLYIGDSPSRLECRLSWKVRDGLLPELQIDLSPTWVPDQVRFREFADPTTWHSSVLPSGVTRIQVALPSAAMAPPRVSRWRSVPTRRFPAVGARWNFLGPVPWGRGSRMRYGSRGSIPTR